MTAAKPQRPRTFATALAAWPDALTTVLDDPTDRHLQQLCTLLDVMDGDIVRRWGQAGHDARLTSLTECRAAAAAANRAVAAAQVTAAKVRGAKGAAAKREKAEAEARGMIRPERRRKRTKPVLAMLAHLEAAGGTVEHAGGKVATVLASALGYPRPRAVSALLYTLEREGYATRVTNPQRTFRVTITDAGRELLHTSYKRRPSGAQSPPQPRKVHTPRTAPPKAPRATQRPVTPPKVEKPRPAFPEGLRWERRPFDEWQARRGAALGAGPGGDLTDLA